MNHPLRIEWEITSVCPLSCPDCSCRQDERGPDLSREDQLAVARRIRHRASLVSLSGGEPLVHPFWEDLVHSLKQGSTKVQMLTSGCAWDSDTARRLGASGLSRVWVGVDAVGAGHDAFRRQTGLWDQVNRAIEDLRARDIPLGVVTTIRSENRRALPGIAAWIQKNRIPDWYVWRAVGSSACVDTGRISLPDVGPGTRLWIGDTLRPREVVCEAGDGVLGIASDGRVRGCLLQLGKPFVGHILQSELDSLQAAARAGRPSMGCLACHAACHAPSPARPLLKTAVMTATLLGLGVACTRPTGEPTLPTPEARVAPDSASEPPQDPPSEPDALKGEVLVPQGKAPAARLASCCYSRMLIPNCVCDYNSVNPESQDTQENPGSPVPTEPEESP